MAKWIDADYSLNVGDLRFLVEVHNANDGGTRWAAHERPLHTNQSHEPRLYGWCGENNNRSRYARGLVRVVRIAATTERAQVVNLRGDELAAALESIGYPELIPAASVTERVAHTASVDEVMNLAGENTRATRTRTL